MLTRRWLVRSYCTPLPHAKASWKARASTTSADAERLLPKHQAKMSAGDRPMMKKFQQHVDEVRKEADTKGVAPRRQTIFHFRKTYGDRFVIAYCVMYAVGMVVLFALFHTRMLDKDTAFAFVLSESNHNVVKSWDIPVSLCLAFVLNELAEFLRFPLLLALRGVRF